MIRTFEDLIAPVSVEAFRADYQEPKRPRLFRGDPNRFRDALNWQTFSDLVNDVPRHDTKFRFTFYGCDSPEDNWFAKPNPLRFNRPTLDLSVVARHIANGHTCVLREVEGFSPGLQAIASTLEKQFGGVCAGNLFFSQPHGHAVSAHCDFPDLFVVQLEGRKRWHLLEPPVESSLDRKETFAEPRNKDSKLEVMEEHVLEPGDVLYVPSGVFHHAMAIEPSLHVSYGLVALNLPHFLRFVLDEWKSQQAPLYAWDRIDGPNDFERVFGQFSQDLMGDWGNRKMKEFTSRYYTPRKRIDVERMVAEAASKAVATADV